MPHEPGSLSAVCEWADALHLELVEATLRLEGGTAGRGGAEAFALAIREFHAAAARVAEVPAATPAELAMKALVTRYYLPPVSSGRDRTPIESLINDAVCERNARGDPTAT